MLTYTKSKAKLLLTNTRSTKENWTKNKDYHLQLHKNTSMHLIDVQLGEKKKKKKRETQDKNVKQDTSCILNIVLLLYYILKWLDVILARYIFLQKEAMWRRVLMTHKIYLASW